MSKSAADAALDLMYEGYIEDVNAEARSYQKDGLPEEAVGLVHGMLREDGVLRENLMTAIERGNLQMMTTPNEGQGVYSFSTQTLAVSAEHLANAARDHTVEYNLHFTLAHESRHAVDAAQIRDASQTLSNRVVATAQQAPPHDYTDIAREYLARDRTFEVDAETTGINAHVSRVVAKHPEKEVSLYDIYLMSPKDMESYVDIRQTDAGPTATYKEGLVPTADGIHLDAENPQQRETMGRLFYQEKGYEWRQGLNGVLNAINRVESETRLDFGDGNVVDVRKDPRLPPQIDFRALGVEPPADPAERVALGRVLDSSLPKPNEQGAPDRAYFDFLREKLPQEQFSDGDVAHAMLKAKQAGMADPAHVDGNAVGNDQAGRIWIGGQHGERISHDPAQTQPLAKTAQDLLTHAYEQAHRPAEEAPQKQRFCALM